MIPNSIHIFYFLKYLKSILRNYFVFRRNSFVGAIVFLQLFCTSAHVLFIKLWRVNILILTFSWPDFLAWLAGQNCWSSIRMKRMKFVTGSIFQIVLDLSLNILLLFYIDHRSNYPNAFHKMHSLLTYILALTFPNTIIVREK